MPITNGTFNVKCFTAIGLRVAFRVFVHAMLVILRWSWLGMVEGYHYSWIHQVSMLRVSLEDLCEVPVSTVHWLSSALLNMWWFTHRKLSTTSWGLGINLGGPQYLGSQNRTAMKNRQHLGGSHDHLTFGKDFSLMIILYIKSGCLGQQPVQ